jgi:hypothetical protein
VLGAVPPAVQREAVLERLGVYGVRLGVSLVQSGAASTASALAAELARRSGLLELRHLLDTQFAERAGLLKARAALAVLDDVLRRYPIAGSDRLEGELEALVAGAHELAELRLLVALRTGAVELSEALATEVDALLSTAGRAPADRPAGDPLDAIERWRRVRSHPLTAPDVGNAADIVIRTYEGLLALR